MTTKVQNRVELKNAKQLLSDSYPNNFVRILPPEVYHFLVYYELVVKVDDKGRKAFTYFILTDKYFCLVERGAKKAFPPIRLLQIANVEKLNDRPDFLEASLAVHSVHFFISYFPKETEPAVRLDIYTFKEVSKVYFLVERLWIGSKMSAVLKSAVGTVSPTASRKIGNTRPFGLGSHELRALQTVFFEIESEILGSTSLEGRLHGLDELSVAASSSPHVKRLFYQHGEALYKLMLDQLRRYGRPNTASATEYCREDELEYVCVILECLCSVLCGSEGIPDRLSLVSYPKPYSACDAVCTLVSVCLQDVSFDLHLSSDLVVLMDRVNDLVVSALFQLESLSEQSSLECNGGYSVGSFVSDITSTPDFVTRRAPALLRRMIAIVMDDDQLAPQLPPNRCVTVYEHCRLLHMLLSRSIPLRRQIRILSEEEIKYFVADPKFFTRLDTSDDFFALRSTDLVQQIVSMCDDAS